MEDGSKEFTIVVDQPVRIMQKVKAAVVEVGLPRDRRDL